MNNEIKKVVEETLNKLTIPFEKVEIIEQDGRVIFMINTDEARFLIGGNGANLSAFNHIIKRVFEKKNPNNEIFGFTVDVNNYQANRNEEIKNKTVIIGNRVKSFHTNIEMEPMSSYERMIVHSTLTEDNDIETESVGYGRERRVVIKFKK